MRFPEADPELELEAQSTALDLSAEFIAPAFRSRDSNIDDLELGFFASETRDQIHARRLRNHRWFNTALVVLVVLASSSWVISMIMVTRR